MGFAPFASAYGGLKHNLGPDVVVRDLEAETRRVPTRCSVPMWFVRSILRQLLSALNVAICHVGISWI